MTDTPPPGVDPEGEIVDRAALDAAQTGPEPEPEIRPFATFLHDHQRGSLHADLTRGLSDLIDAVLALQNKGTLTLKLTVVPKGLRAVEVTADVTAKPPLVAGEPAFYYVDRARNLSRTDPEILNDFAEALLREPARPDPAQAKDVTR